MHGEICQNVEVEFRRNEMNLKSRPAAMTVRPEAAVQATNTYVNKGKGKGERQNLIIAGTMTGKTLFISLLFQN